MDSQGVEDVDVVLWSRGIHLLPPRLEQQPRDLEGDALNGAIASVAHLAYHFGAIRQIDRSIRGPSEEEAPS